MIASSNNEIENSILTQFRLNYQAYHNLRKAAEFSAIYYTDGELTNIG